MFLSTRYPEGLEQKNIAGWQAETTRRYLIFIEYSSQKALLQRAEQAAHRLLLQIVIDPAIPLFHPHKTTGEQSTHVMAHGRGRKLQLLSQLQIVLCPFTKTGKNLELAGIAQRLQAGRQLPIARPLLLQHPVSLPDIKPHIAARLRRTGGDDLSHGINQNRLHWSVRSKGGAQTFSACKFLQQAGQLPLYRRQRFLVSRFAAPHRISQTADPFRGTFQQANQSPACSGSNSPALQNLHQLCKARRLFERPLGNGLSKSQANGFLFRQRPGKPFRVFGAHRLNQQQKILIQLAEKQLGALWLHGWDSFRKSRQITAVNRLAQSPQRLRVNALFPQSPNAGLHTFFRRAAQCQQADDLEQRVQCISRIHPLFLLTGSTGVKSCFQYSRFSALAQQKAVAAFAKAATGDTSSLIIREPFLQTAALPVHINLHMAGVSGGVAGAAHGADHRALLRLSVHTHIQAVQMGIQGAHAARMLNDHIVAVAVMVAGGGHHTGGHGAHLGPTGRNQIRAFMVVIHPAAHIGVSGHRPDQRHRRFTAFGALLPGLPHFTFFHHALDKLQIAVIPHDTLHRSLQGDPVHLPIVHQQALLVVKGPTAHLIQPVRRTALDHILPFQKGLVLLVVVLPGHALFLAHPLHAGLPLGKGRLFLRLRHGSGNCLPGGLPGLLLQKAQLLQPVFGQAGRRGNLPRRQPRRRAGGQTDGGKQTRRRGQYLAAAGFGLLKQRKQPGFQIFRPGTHARSAGRQRAGRSRQQYPPVCLALLFVQPAHCRLVTGQFTHPLQPGCLPVAGRIKPVDPASQTQRRLAPQIAAVQMGQFMAERQFQGFFLHVPGKVQLRSQNPHQQRSAHARAHPGPQRGNVPAFQADPAQQALFLFAQRAAQPVQCPAKTQIAHQLPQSKQHSTQCPQPGQHRQQLACQLGLYRLNRLGQRGSHHRFGTDVHGMYRCLGRIFQRLPHRFQPGGAPYPRQKGQQWPHRQQKKACGAAHGPPLPAPAQPIQQWGESTHQQ